MNPFATRLLDWFDRHGRKDLPWQQEPTPYRVWVSEIMLQQTQVATVIPYYQRFMQRFPDLASLAAASQDEVLHHWSGLGYYARGRNLHRAAGQVMEEYEGCLPTDIDGLQALPGIGRSTAAAILSFTSGQRHPILDGNVKRVLTRHHGIEGWPGNAQVSRELWAIAGQLTPGERVADYTQAIMDLGATCCTRSRPACDNCPLSSDCVAKRHGLQGLLPTKKPARKLPHRKTTFIILHNEQGEVMLQQRPPAGIWGGLWSFPEFDHEQDGDIRHWCEQQLGVVADTIEYEAPIKHVFSHFQLNITPARITVAKNRLHVQDNPSLCWYRPDNGHALGLAAPVAKLINTLGG